ncbi:universal stress protein [Mesorhizobium sp. M0633]|uniref:universal stress protein n=1 Tax=Mesorhizobium sp. M0633 TaxID=2956977 RepID=UPI003337998A
MCYKESICDSLADVPVFLEHHGITVRNRIHPGDGDGEQLVAFARMIHTDLMVSGACSHSRLREWAFGGVTRTLMEESSINRFMLYWPPVASGPSRHRLRHAR